MGNLTWDYALISWWRFKKIFVVKFKVFLVPCQCATAVAIMVATPNLSDGRSIIFQHEDEIVRNGYIFECLFWCRWWFISAINKEQWSCRDIRPVTFSKLSTEPLYTTELKAWNSLDHYNKATCRNIRQIWKALLLSTRYLTWKHQNMLLD